LEIANFPYSLSFSALDRGESFGISEKSFTDLKKTRVCKNPASQLIYLYTTAFLPNALWTENIKSFTHDGNYITLRTAARETWRSDTTNSTTVQDADEIWTDRQNDNRGHYTLTGSESRVKN